MPRRDFAPLLKFATYLGSTLLANSVTCISAQTTTTTTTSTATTQPVIVWTIFPPDLYDTANFPTDYPIYISAGCAMVVAIVLTIGIGCYCIEKKRRTEARMLQHYQKTERDIELAEEERRREEEEARKRAKEAARKAEEEAREKALREREKATAEQTAAEDTSSPSRRSMKNWGMETSFIF